MRVVYTFTNLNTGAQFVGVTINLRKAASEHVYMLRLGSHMSRTLQADWNRQGSGDFKFAIVEVLPRGASQQDGKRAVAKWIEQLRPVYNKGIEPGAESDY